MGKSRSATVICAYLMYHYNITPDAALAKLREARPFAEPNDGFWKQLQLYHSIGPHKPLGTSPLYQKWLFEREMELSRVRRMEFYVRKKRQSLKTGGCVAM